MTVPLAEYLVSPQRITSAEFASDVEKYLDLLARHPLVIACRDSQHVLLDASQAMSLASALFESACDAIARAEWAPRPDAQTAENPKQG